jgi:soluble lytic murein transglycosylase
MPFFLLFVSTLLLAVTGSAIAAPLYRFPDQQLETAARELKKRNYRTVSELVEQAPAGGLRDFMAGLAAMRLDRRDEALAALGRAAGTLPVLGDYALKYQAQLLADSDRRQEAIPLLQNLLRQYPDSPLARQSLLQLGDLQFDTGSFADAYVTYQLFVERYAAGSDALQAAYRSALCKEQLGETAAAAALLRSVWLTSPASPLAAKAEDDLQRLAAKGAVVPPYTQPELLRRGSALVDLRRYEQALKTFRTIDPTGQTAEADAKLSLKIAQTLFKSRQYQEADQAFRRLLTPETPQEVALEAYYWLARTMDKQGRDEEAFAAFMTLAQVFPASELADDAFLDAAFIRKFQYRPAETVATLQQLLAAIPDPPQKNRIYWEIAWGSYLCGNWATSRTYLEKLLDDEQYRERALYWLGRTHQADGRAGAARDTLLRVRREFPFGYYGVLARQELNMPDEPLPQPQQPLTELLPLPDGYERVKLLISLGLTSEAGRELAARKKNGKGRPQSGLARLYLEMDDYSGALNLYRSDMPGSVRRENLPVWGVLYPLAFREYVAQAPQGVPESLVYAVMRAESTYQPAAVSPVGARGLMQLMPATAAAIVKNGKSFNADQLFSPELNIRCGTRHLKDLLDRYDGDTIAVIAAYNAGAHNVDRWRKTFPSRRGDEFIESIPFGETREYVKKVLATADLYRRLYRLK